MTCRPIKYAQKHFLKENLFALQVYRLTVCVRMCAHTRTAKREHC